MGLVGRIGKTLGLKADCTSCRESGSMGTFKAPEPVSCVELDAIFSGIYFHRSPAVGLYAGGCKAQLSTFSLVQYIAMVISCAIHNLRMFLINSFTKSMLACITGGIAEAFYGMSEDWKIEVLRRLPEAFVEVVEEFYQKI